MFSLIDSVIAFASRNIVRTAFTLCILGLVLAGWSFAIDVHSIEFNGRLDGGAQVGDFDKTKQVGYALAPNWAIYSIILMPLIVGFGLYMRAQMEPTLAALADAGMVRGADFQRVPASLLIERWDRDRRGNYFIIAAVIAIAFAVSMLDWWKTIYPLRNGFPYADPTLADQRYEFDWSVAHLFFQSGVAPGETLVFSFVAYLLVAALGCATILGLMIEGVLFIAFACGLTPSAEAKAASGETLPATWKLAASPADSRDDRCGFGAFKSFFTALLCAALVILPALLLMMSQNAYLRDPSTGSWAEFLLADWQAVLDVLKRVGKEPAAAWNLFASSKNVDGDNWQTFIGVALVLFVVTVCLAGCWLVLRIAAINAQAYARRNAGTLAEELHLSASDVSDRLDRMKYWPLGWVTLNQAIAVVGLMFFSVFSFRLILLPVAAVLVIIVVRTLGAFAKQLTPSQPATAPAGPAAPSASPPPASPTAP